MNEVKKEAERIRRRNNAACAMIFIGAVAVWITALLIGCLITAKAKGVNSFDVIGKEKVYISVQIQKGETLTSLYEEYGTEISARKEWVEEVEQINHMQSDKIISGAYVICPTAK